MQTRNAAIVTAVETRPRFNFWRGFHRFALVVSIFAAFVGFAIGFSDRQDTITNGNIDLSAALVPVSAKSDSLAGLGVAAIPAQTQSNSWANIGVPATPANPFAEFGGTLATPAPSRPEWPLATEAAYGLIGALIGFAAILIPLEVSASAFGWIVRGFREA